MELGDRLDKLAELKEREHQLKQQAKDAETERKNFEAETYELMRETKNLSVRRPGGSFSAKSTVYGHVRDPDAFQAWVEEQDMVDEFLTTKPVGQRLNEFVREALDNGADLPPGVTWYPKDYISFTRS